MPGQIDTQGQEYERRKKSQRPVKQSVYLSIINHAKTDAVSSWFHSADFTQTRYSYVAVRLKLMCLFFAIMVPVFALFDFLTLPSEQAQFLLKARIALSASLFFLGYVLYRQTSVVVTRIVITLTFLVPTVFYLCSMQSFSVIPDGGIPLFFSMMPYLIMAMLGLFPLTISGGLFLAGVISIPVALFEVSRFNGDYYALFNTLWLLSLFAGISLWLQTGQLLMLLKLYRESTVDPLTELINRRVLLRQASQEQKKSAEDSQPFSVMMFDLDRFKRINDYHGHATGDQVLVTVARIMKHELRSTDIIARFGGEEFVAVLPGVPLGEATQVAHRVAHSIRNTAIPLNDGENLYVTSSIGVTQYKVGENIEQTLKRADDLLYQAKASGRDKVVDDQTQANESGQLIADKVAEVA